MKQKLNLLVFKAQIDQFSYVIHTCIHSSKTEKTNLIIYTSDTVHGKLDKIK